MKWLILGAILGLLLAYPSLLGLVLAGAAAVIAKPVVVAFGLGITARPHLRRWAR